MIPLYVWGIALSDLGVWRLGPDSAPLMGGLVVGLDLVVRNRLHALWSGRRVWPRMIGLTALGAGLSALIYRDSAPVAWASFDAYLFGGLSATLAWDAAGGRDDRRCRWTALAVGSAVDALVFTVVAFRAAYPVLIVRIMVCKLLGGVVWSEIMGLALPRYKPPADEPHTPPAPPWRMVDPDSTGGGVGRTTGGQGGIFDDDGDGG